MTIKQGSIDQLCGLYSVLNATEILIGKYPPYDRRLRVASQKKHYLPTWLLIWHVKTCSKKR